MNQEYSNNEVKKNSNIDKNRIIFSIIIIVVTLCVIVGVSYALFQYQRTGNKTNEVRTGTLVLTLDDTKGTYIDVSNAVPVSDQVGLIGTPYQFTLRNDGTLASSYTITLIYDQTHITQDKCGTKQLSYEQVKYNLVKNSDSNTPALLNTLTNYVIDAGTLLPNETNTYELRLWLDQGITDPTSIAGKHFHVKLKVEAAQTNYPR